MSFGTVTWVRFPLTGKRTAISNCTQPQIEAFLVLAEIHDYPEEGWILSRKCNTWKDCPGYLTSLNTNNVNFCRQNRPYQSEAFGPSGPSLGFGTKNSCRFFAFCSASTPSLDCLVWLCIYTCSLYRTTHKQQYDDWFALSVSVSVSLLFLSHTHTHTHIHFLSLSLSLSCLLFSLLISLFLSLYVRHSQA